MADWVVTVRFEDAFNEVERQLIEGFLGLVEDKPYGKISVKELTARCHVARTSFYRYFEDTLDMLERLEEYLLGELVLYRGSRARETEQVCGGKSGERHACDGKPYESIRAWFEAGLRLRGLLAPVMGPNGDIYFKERLIVRVRDELHEMMDDEGVRRDERRPYYVAAIAASYVGLLHFMVLQPDDCLLSGEELIKIANSTRVAYFTGDASAPVISDAQLYGGGGGE